MSNRMADPTATSTTTELRHAGALFGRVMQASATATALGMLAALVTAEWFLYAPTITVDVIVALLLLVLVIEVGIGAVTPEK